MKSKAGHWRVHDIVCVFILCKKKEKEKKEYYTKSKSDTCAEEKWNKFKVISVWSPIQAAASSPGSFHYTPHLWLPERAPIY